MLPLTTLVLLTLHLTGMNGQNVGDQCSASGTCTGPVTVCDTDNVCRLQVGADCTVPPGPTDPSGCVLNAVCQGTTGNNNGPACECGYSIRDGLCVTANGADGDNGSPCTGGLGGSCTTPEAMCDLDGVCRIKAGSSGCDDTSPCVRGAECTTGTCGCTAPAIALPNGLCDIDECAGGTAGCSQACTNLLGSFECSCNTGYQLNADGKTCDDINECGTANGGCGETCTNKPGTYECSCSTGYKLAADMLACEDIDECAGSTSCAQTCVNDPGSYHCTCKNNYHLDTDGFGCTDACTFNNGGCGQNCTFDSAADTFSCSCELPGYTLNADLTTCDDIDECAQGGPANCQEGCKNTPGSFECTCPSGYVLGGDTVSCDDIDECALNTCSQLCANEPGSFTCSCNSGYTLAIDKTTCNDDDECALGTNGCVAPATCVNTPGLYSCTCPPGYRLAANQMSCDEINECQEGTSGCAQLCTNNPGTYTCGCNPGFTLNANQRSCDDINECASSVLNGCEHQELCTNKPGSFDCGCRSGYLLNQADGKSCDDINECAIWNGGCRYFCRNTLGGHRCYCPRFTRPKGTKCIYISPWYYFLFRGLF